MTDDPGWIEAWGSTHAERRADDPIDGLIGPGHLLLHRAVSVDAPADVLFGWLCQLRVAPYSYDWIDNLGRRSPDERDPTLTDLSIGQRFMTVFRLIEFEQGRSITLRSRSRMAGEWLVTYRAEPSGPNESRLVAKVAMSPPDGFLGRLQRLVLPAGDLVMMRRQLLRLAEHARREAIESRT